MLCRPENSVVVNGDYVVKTGLTDRARAKIFHEVMFYLDLPKHMKRYFPTLIGFAPGTYTMSLVRGPTLYEWLLKPRRNSELRMVEADLKHWFDLCAAGGNCGDEALRRASQSQYVKLPEARGVKPDLRIGPPLCHSVIHGDLHYDNIIVSDEGLKFIDPRGLWGFLPGIFGDLDYDRAKLYQSVCGYNCLLHGKSVHQHIELPFQVTMRIKMITVQLLRQLGPFHANPQPFYELGEKIATHC